MPPGMKKKRNSPDKIVLPMQPFHRREWEYSDDDASEHFRVVQGFSEELRLLINHVAALLPRPWGVARQLQAWFHDIEQALDEIERATRNGWWTTGSVTIDSDGVSLLDEALDGVPDLTGSFSKSAADRCASRLLMMWLNEIVRRGREIIFLSIMAIDVRDADGALNHLKSMRYPVR